MATPGTLEYPAALDTAVSLFEATNRATTTLSAQLTAGATTASLTSAAGFPSSGSVTIDDERIYYTGKSGSDLTGLVRGRESSSDATHTAGSLVEGRITARHRTVLADAVIALEGKLGTGADTPVSGDFLKGTGAGVSAWSALASGDVTGALGFTPADAALVATDAELAASLLTSVILAPATAGRNVIQPTADVLALKVQAPAAAVATLVDIVGSSTITNTSLMKVRRPGVGSWEVRLALANFPVFDVRSDALAALAGGEVDFFGGATQLWAFGWGAYSATKTIFYVYNGPRATYPFIIDGETDALVFGTDYWDFGVQAAQAQVYIGTQNVARPAVKIVGKAGQTANILDIYTSAGKGWGVAKGGQEYLDVTATPADGDVPTSQRVQWYEDTVGATMVRFKQRDSAGTLVTGIAAGLDTNGYFILKKIAAPADGALAASQAALWLDDTPGATALNVKAKDSGGTVRTVTIPLG